MSTKIKYEYSRLINTSDGYNGIKVAFGIEVEVDVDVPVDVAAETKKIMAQCEEVVHSQIDDKLEKAGLSPEFYKGPLYRVLSFPKRERVLLFNDKDLIKLPSDWQYVWETEIGKVPHGGARYLIMRDHAKALAKEKGYFFLDAAKWLDESLFPPLPEQKTKEEDMPF